VASIPASFTKGLASAIADVRTIAREMGTLPELARLLEQIRASTESMDKEVKEMRQSVEALHPRLDELQDSIPLSRRRKQP